MKLINGVKITGNLNLISSKVFVNSGVELCPERIEGKSSMQYDKNCYKPKSDWRKLVQREIDILFANQYKKVDYSESILLKKMPDRFISILKKLEIGNCKNFADVQEKIREHKDLIKKFQEEFQEVLRIYARDLAEVNFHRLVFNPPAIEMLTYHMNEGKLFFVGLHIDRSTIFDFSNVNVSKNRLCINIGNEDRILYFVNLTLNQILELLKKKRSVNISKITINNIGEIFFSEFPDYPVIKLIQSPFDYYIAPTDNILHDGSTSEKVHHDICFVYLGRFNTYPKNASVISL